MNCGRVHNDEGFSFVEIMVALFVLGLAASVVVVSLPEPETPLERASHDTNTLIISARNSARLGGAAYGIAAFTDEIALMTFREGEWRMVRDKAGLKPVALDQDVEVSVRGDFRQVDLTLRRADWAKENARITPDIWFDSSGIAQSRELVLSDDEHLHSFQISPSGNVRRLENERR